MLHFFTDAGNFCLWGTSVLLVCWLGLYTWMGRGGRWWWKNMVGLTFAGLATSVLVIYAPSQLAAVDPSFVGFDHSLWYTWLAIGTVTYTFLIAAAMLATWGYVAWRKRAISK